MRRTDRRRAEQVTTGRCVGRRSRRRPDDPEARLSRRVPVEPPGRRVPAVPVPPSPTPEPQLSRSRRTLSCSSRPGSGPAAPVQPSSPPSPTDPTPPNPPAEPEPHPASARTPHAPPRNPGRNRPDSVNRGTKTDQATGPLPPPDPEGASAPFSVLTRLSWVLNRFLTSPGSGGSLVRAVRGNGARTLGLHRFRKSQKSSGAGAPGNFRSDQLQRSAAGAPPS